MENSGEKIQFYIILALSFVFFAIYAYLPWSTAPKQGERIFNSPDETANYVFSKLYAQQNQLTMAEPINHQYDNIIHPRSVQAINGKLAPVSFLGLILLFGFIAKFIGVWSIVYLTPLLSIPGVIYYYKLIKNIFSPAVAFFSSLLLLIFPGWWYYNARSMFHNILFIDFLIIGLFYFYNFLIKPNPKNSLLYSLFFSLALIVRTSEILWLLPLVVVLLFLNRKRLNWKSVAISLITVIVIFTPILVYQRLIYGQTLATGYTAPIVSGLSANITAGNPIIKKISAVILPFGFHPRRALINFYNYYPIIFWWIFIPSAVGFLANLIKFHKLNNKRKIYLISFIYVSSFLIIFYGSWYFSDNLNPDKITIGTSYVRYWLPIYIFSLPFLGLIIRKLVKFIQGTPAKIIIVLIIFCAMFYLSAKLTVVDTGESLSSVRDRIGEYYQKREAVSEIIPVNSIIIAERTDKIFFPVYRVIAGFDQGKVMANLPQLVKSYPVYYYTFLNPADIDKVSYILEENNLKLSDGKNIFANESLYRLEILNSGN